MFKEEYPDNKIEYMMAIDPSIRAMGWAWFWREGFHSCGLCRSKEDFPEAVRDQIEQLPGYDAHYLVVEKPQVYDPRQWKGDPNDLITLAILCGAVLQSKGHRHCRHDMVTPQQWKGQTPKEIIEYRVRQALSSRESRLAEELIGEYPKHLQHNIWESIGIGLFALRRLHV